MAKFQTVSGFCSTTKKPVGFQLKVEGSDYYAVGSFTVSPGASGASATDLHGKIFNGGFKCKFCGNTSFFQCDCGKLICVAAGAPEATCPGCNKTWQLRMITADEVKETTVKGINQ